MWGLPSSMIASTRCSFAILKLKASAKFSCPSSVYPDKEVSRKVMTKLKNRIATMGKDEDQNRVEHTKSG